MTDEARTYGQLRVTVASHASAFLSAVYGWMCAGLLITAATAWYVARSSTAVRVMLTNSGVFWTLAIAQLVIVFVLSARVQRLTAAAASVLFLVYSCLTGLTMAFVVLAYTGESLGTTFLVTAGMFGSLAGYGTITKRDLGGLGQFLFLGLVGVVLMSVVGIFWHNNGVQFVLSFIGVVLFSGLTAYDAQRLKIMALQSPEGETTSYAIVGALSLYLDFTNLFLFLLRFTGSRRDWSD
jgi:hypothetical protein